MGRLRALAARVKHRENVRQQLAEIAAEDKRFWERKRFDQSTFWKDDEREPRSLIGSSWPSLEEWLMKFCPIGGHNTSLRNAARRGRANNGVW